MGESSKNFLQSLKKLKIKNTELMVALLWWHGLADPAIEISPKQLCDEIHDAGYPKQNVSRMAENLGKDKRTSKGIKRTFRIKITEREKLENKYLSYVKQRPIPASDSLLPTDMFKNSRGYIEKVVSQINASHDTSLFDYCAVMCRRLLETLVIEVYEHKGWADELKGPDGHFMMFSGLLSHIEKEKRFNLGRNSLSGLKNFKKLGDESAHNRRFNAKKSDIDRIRDGMRVATEELLHLANLN